MTYAPLATMSSTVFVSRVSSAEASAAPSVGWRRSQRKGSRNVVIPFPTKYD